MRKYYRRTNSGQIKGGVPLVLRMIRPETHSIQICEHTCFQQCEFDFMLLCSVEFQVGKYELHSQCSISDNNLNCLILFLNFPS